MIFLKPDETISVFPDPKKADKPLGKISDRDNVQALGIMELAAASFVQIQCPSSLKCDDGIGYIERDGISVDDSLPDDGPRVVTMDLSRALEGGAKRLRETRDYYLNPSRPVPDEMDARMISAMLMTIQGEDERMTRMQELALLADALDNPDQAKDERLSAIKRKYSALSAGESESAKKKNASLQTAIRKSLKELASKDERYTAAGVPNIIEGFPFRANNWAGLAQDFRRLGAMPYIQERIAAAALEGVDYSIDPALPDAAGTQKAEWKIEIKPLEGVFLRARILPEQKKTDESTKPSEGEPSDIRIQTVSAEPSRNGIAFVITTTAGKFKIAPSEIPPYLAKGGPGLDSFIASIPQDWQKIEKDNDFARAAMLVAMKFGTRREMSAADNGRLVYTVDLSSSKYHYWMMFDLLKKSPNIIVEGQGFNGRLGRGTYSTLGPMAVESWYQPRGEFKIQYRTIMGRGGESALTEMTCFSEGSGVFVISFPPSDIHKDNPDTHIELDTPGGEVSLCGETIRNLNVRKDN